MDLLPELKSYLLRKRWAWKRVSGDNVAVKTCPFCGRSKWKFQIHVQKTIYRCFHCDARGNLYKLRRELGDMQGVVSAAQAAAGEGKARNAKPVEMEHIERWHRQLLKNQKALRYLHEVRGFNDETIGHFKLGLAEIVSRISNLNPGQVEMMVQTTREGYTDQILEAIHQISQQDPELGDVLFELANKYEHEKILPLFREAGSDN